MTALHKLSDLPVETIDVALSHIDANCDRDTWARIGMALKNELGDPGFDVWDQWSRRADNYDQRDARDTWRSIRATGGVTIATVIHMAKENGYRPDAKPKTIDPAAAAARRAQREAQAAQEAAELEKRQAQAAELAHQLFESATPVISHPYLTRKGITRPGGVRVGTYPRWCDGETVDIEGALLIPIRNADGKVATLQAIFPGADNALGRDRDYLPGGRKDGCYFNLGKPTRKAGELVLIGEGYATCATAHEATGAVAVVAFDAGNLPAVAQAIRTKLPEARIVILADNDRFGRRNTGLEKATEAARLVGGHVAMPTFPSDDGKPTDFNDLHLLEGLDLVREQIEQATKQVAPVENGHALEAAPPFEIVPIADLAHVTPEAPTFWIEDYVPAGVVTLLGAHGGTGKSFLGLMAAVCIASGQPLLNLATREGIVAFFSGEDPAEVVRHRLKWICSALNVDPASLEGRLLVLDATAGDPVLFHEVNAGGVRFGATSATYGHLQTFIDQHGVDVLIVDNASDAFDASEIDRARVRGFMRALARIAQARQGAVLLLAHVDKGTSRRERSDSEGYSGSTAWHNSARSRLFLSRDKDGGLTLEHQKSNLGTMREPLALHWPKGGVIEVAKPLSSVVQGIAQKNGARSLLRLIHEFYERGEFVSTATTSRTHAGKLLRGQPGFPSKLKDQELFEMLRSAERRGWLSRETYQGTDRKPRERWRLMPAGEIEAGLQPSSAAHPENDSAAGLPQGAP